MQNHRVILTASILASLAFGGQASAAADPSGVTTAASPADVTATNEAPVAQRSSTATSAAATPRMALAQASSAAVTAPKKSKKKKVQTLQAVQVTGSLITRADLATSEPLQVVTEKQLRETGHMTLASMLSQLPVTGGGVNVELRGILVPGGEAGAATGIDLHGLGASRTLVLVNGMRWATQGSGAVDMATIPSGMVDHVEVLTDGASAIYGSDAISGVVNIITKKNFNGAQLRASDGTNLSHADGRRQHFDLTMGSSHGKGSVMMDIEYTNRETVWGDTRAITRYPDGVYHPDSGYQTIGPKGQFCIVDAAGNCGPNYVLNQVGDNPLNLNNYHLFTGNPEDEFNRNSYEPFQEPLRQKSVYVQGNYHISGNVTAYASALYNHYNVRAFTNPASISWSQFTAPILGGKNFPMSADSIYNPTNQPLGNPNASPIGYFIRTMEEPSLASFTNATQHFDAGVKGTFDVGERSFNWNVFYDYNHTQFGKAFLAGGYNFLNVENALGPSYYDNGVPTCGVPGSPVPGCTPWNILGGTATMTPAAAQYIFSGASTTDFDTQKEAQATISGNLFRIPVGGAVSAALGIDHRTLRAGSTPGGLIQAGIFENPVKPTLGSYGVNSVFGELHIVALKNMTGVRRLSFDIASRHSRYSTFGGTTDSKYQFRYQPIKDLVVNGDYSQSFRAPSITELFGGTTDVNPVYLDPCDAQFGAQVYGAGVYSSCVASLRALGISSPTSFEQVDRTGIPVTSAAGAKPPHAFVTGSNPDLGPETAIVRNVGVVYSPHYAPGFSVTVNWYSIDLNNVISVPTAGDILSQAYLGDTSLFSRFSRDPTTGQISSLNFSTENAGQIQTKGFDIHAEYRLSLGSVGDFDLRSNSTIVTTFQEKTVGTSAWNSINGTYQPQDAFWRRRNVTSLTWSKDRFTVTWRARYFSGLMEPCLFVGTPECNDANFSSAALGPSPMMKTGGVTFNDFIGTWRTPWRSQITVGINDAFKKRLPVQYAAGARNAPINFAYDIDRFLYVEYTQEL